MEKSFVGCIAILNLLEAYLSAAAVSGAGVGW